MEKITNYGNSVSWWRKNNILIGKENISALKEALEEAKNDYSVSLEDILEITKMLQEAYK